MLKPPRDSVAPTGSAEPGFLSLPELEVLIDLPPALKLALSVFPTPVLGLASASVPPSALELASPTGFLLGLKSALILPLAPGLDLAPSSPPFAIAPDPQLAETPGPVVYVETKL